jgi:hypothetical protein
MAESVDSLFRRGMISPRQGAKLGVLKGTRAQNSKMASFDDKAGKRDQGGRADHGDKQADSRHINRNQRAGSKIASQPTKGGFSKQARPPTDDEIDQRDVQKPDFPKGAGKLSRPAQKAFVPSPANKLAAKKDAAGSNNRSGNWGTAARAKGGNPKSSGSGANYYGGPNSRANG